MRIKIFLFLVLLLAIIASVIFISNSSSSKTKLSAQIPTPATVSTSTPISTSPEIVGTSDSNNSVESTKSTEKTEASTSAPKSASTPTPTPVPAPKTISTSTVSIPVKKIESFKLNVPYFTQQYKNSCEASALRMALAYYNIKVDDDLEIVQKFGYKPREKDVIKNEWDDPQEMFVGNIDILGSTQGYGVYGKPVAKAVVSYGRTALYKTEVTPQFLSSEIKAGHPIILWGYTSITTSAYTWNLASGGEVKAFKGEHARLVVGFAGPVDNPIGFYVHDPFNGKKFEYWSLEDLVDQIYAVPGVTNQAVVVK